MKLITRKTIQTRSERTLPYVTIQKESIYFTMAAAEQFGLRVGKYVHFINDDSSWTFFVCDDPDGFMLTPMSSGVRIHSNPLTRMLRQQFKIKQADSFYLHETPRNIKGAKLIEIAFGSPVIKVTSTPKVDKS